MSKFVQLLGSATGTSDMVLCDTNIFISAFNGRTETIDQFSVQVEGAAANAMLRVQVVAPNGNIVHDASVQNGQVLAHAFAPGFYVCRIYLGEELADVVKLVIMP